ncbi:hypothetical protein [Vibrio parahaemolyticus]|uniref:hypothetical protein n=1 Tax=Vibrio parahaemolyticus TaxID=670 RepID=UPI00111DAD0C|nr:hypothetical protein [Vibrio parahaemolyticus]TOG95084.1 hypothetical protein CGI92_14085 [Vibrio parahaemolyticus]
MEQLIPLDHALALAYFKEGFPYGEDNHRLFEEVSNGGDLEFFTLVLEQFIPVIERYLATFELDAPDRLYLFYGEAFPYQLKQLLEHTPNPTAPLLEQCAQRTLQTLAQTMRDIRQ